MADINATIADLSQKVALIDQKVTSINERTDQNNQSQERLLKELHDLTGTIRVLIEKHDHVRESADRMWKQHEELSTRVRTLETFQATNQPIIEALRDLNKKMIGMVMAALLAAVIAPFATVTYIIKQMPEQAGIRHEQNITTSGDPKQ